MKNLIFTLTLLVATMSFVWAQELPSFQFGVKAGANLAGLDFNSTAFSNSNQLGYLGGFWARIGGSGFNLQPEVYLTSKSVDITNDGAEIKQHFTSLDVPLLFGWKMGTLDLGVRFYTGPLASFVINRDQSLSGALDRATTLNYNDQSFAWQFGAGVDIRNISIDLRYEAGITKQDYEGTPTKLNLFNVSLAIPLLSLDNHLFGQ